MIVLIMKKNLESNWNHELRDLFEADMHKYGQVIDQTDIDDYLDQTEKSDKPIDKHTERLIKASWREFVDDRMEKLKEETPKLKRSQLLQMTSKKVCNT